jgi:hypothetical protein
MKKLSMFVALLLLGCPKKEKEDSLAEIERKKKIQELLLEDDEFFENIPEAESDEEDEEE